MAVSGQPRSPVAGCGIPGVLPGSVSTKLTTGDGRLSHGAQSKDPSIAIDISKDEPGWQGKNLPRSDFPPVGGSNDGSWRPRGGSVNGLSLDAEILFLNSTWVTFTGRPVGAGETVRVAVAEFSDACDAKSRRGERKYFRARKLRFLPVLQGWLKSGRRIGEAIFK